MTTTTIRRNFRNSAWAESARGCILCGVSTFRFVHTADLHLDSPLKSLALRDPELAHRIDGATRAALLGIVNLCIEQRVDALLIAGDLYDGEQRSMHTAAYLSAQLRKLRDANIPVFVIRGNHDAESRLTKELTLPDNVHVFSARGESMPLLDGGVVIHGVSFKDVHATQSLLPKYNPPIANAINIGMLHTSIAGGAGHDDYAPCSLGDLTGFGYDYWALGHIHKRAVHAQRPAVVMPGNPQGRHINEDGPRSVSLVAIDELGEVVIEEHHVNSAQFEQLQVDVGGQDDWTRLPDLFTAALRNLRDSVNSDELIVRLQLRGETALHHKLHRDHDLLIAIAHEVAEAIEHVSIDSISLRAVSRLPRLVPAETSDALVQLSRLISSEVIQSVEAQQLGAQEISQLSGKLPPEIRSILGDDDASQAAILKQLIREGSDWMLDQLQGET